MVDFILERGVPEHPTTTKVSEGHTTTEVSEDCKTTEASKDRKTPRVGISRLISKRVYCAAYPLHDVSGP